MEKRLVKQKLSEYACVCVGLCVVLLCHTHTTVLMAQVSKVSTESFEDCWVVIFY